MEWLDVINQLKIVGANISKQERTGGDKLNPQTFSSEGVEGYIPFAGPLKYLLQNFANGIRSGMSYSGAFNLKVLKFLHRNLNKKPNWFRLPIQDLNSPMFMVSINLNDIKVFKKIMLLIINHIHFFSGYLFLSQRNKGSNIYFWLKYMKDPNKIPIPRINPFAG